MFGLVACEGQAKMSGDKWKELTCQSDSKGNPLLKETAVIAPKRIVSVFFLHFVFLLVLLSRSSCPFNPLKVEPRPQKQEEEPKADPERRRAAQEELEGGRARLARLGELVAVFYFELFFSGVEVEVEVGRKNREEEFQCLEKLFFSFPQFHAKSTHTKNAAAAESPEAPKPSASEGKAASGTGGWRGMTA